MVIMHQIEIKDLLLFFGPDFENASRFCGNLGGDTVVQTATGRRSEIYTRETALRMFNADSC